MYRKTAQPSTSSQSQNCAGLTHSHMVLFLVPHMHTGAGGWRHGLRCSHPVTCVVLTVILIELHQHRGRNDQEVPQRRRHRVYHHREPFTQASQTLQHTMTSYTDMSTLQIPKFEQKLPRSKSPRSHHGTQRQEKEMVLSLLHLGGRYICC